MYALAQVQALLERNQGALAVAVKELGPSQLPIGVGALVRVRLVKVLEDAYGLVQEGVRFDCVGRMKKRSMKG